MLLNFRASKYKIESIVKGNLSFKKTMISLTFYHNWRKEFSLDRNFVSRALGTL